LRKNSNQGISNYFAQSIRPNFRVSKNSGAGI